MASLKLTRSAQTTRETGPLPGFHLVVTASEGSGIENQVFLHERRLRDPSDTSGATDDWFIAVCTPLDLVDQPINNPTLGIEPRYFRKASLDLIARSQAEASLVWGRVQEDVTALLRALKNLALLGPSEFVVLDDS